MEFLFVSFFLFFSFLEDFFVHMDFAGNNGNGNICQRRSSLFYPHGREETWIKIYRRRPLKIFLRHPLPAMKASSYFHYFSTMILLMNLLRY